MTISRWVRALMVNSRSMDVSAPASGTGPVTATSSDWMSGMTSPPSSPSGEPDPRIEVGVRDVRQHVEDDHGDRGDDVEAHDRVRIRLGQAVDEQDAHAPPAE